MAEPEMNVERLIRCIRMAMGCISPLSANVDERLAWYRLLDAVEGKEPRDRLEPELRPKVRHTKIQPRVSEF